MPATCLIYDVYSTHRPSRACDPFPAWTFRRKGLTWWSSPSQSSCCGRGHFGQGDGEQQPSATRWGCGDGIWCLPQGRAEGDEGWGTEAGVAWERVTQAQSMDAKTRGHRGGCQTQTLTYTQRPSWTHDASNRCSKTEVKTKDQAGWIDLGRGKQDPAHNTQTRHLFPVP